MSMRPCSSSRRLDERVDVVLVGNVGRYNQCIPAGRLDSVRKGLQFVSAPGRERDTCARVSERLGSRLTDSR